MKIILGALLLFLLSGCAGIGVTATSDPAEKLNQAERMQNENRPVMAETLILESIKIYEGNNDILGLAEAYHAYGNLHKNSIVQQYKTIYDPTYMKSINSFKKSKELFQQANSEIGVVKSLVGIGMCYSMRQEREKACPYYEDALSKYKSGKENGKITKEPTIFIQGYDNFGSIVEQIIKQEECTK